MATNNNNQTRLQDLPPFPMCPRHHEHVKGVCLFPGNCQDRLICRACRKIHDNNHLNYYEGLEDIFNGNLVSETLKDFESMVSKIDANNLTAKQTSQYLIGQIDTQFNEIQAYIIQKLNNVRNAIFEDINQKFRNTANTKQQILYGVNEIQKSFEAAQKSGFQPQFVILNVIHSLCNAQNLKDRISKDPELNQQQAGEITSNYLNTITSGVLLQHVKMSFDRICEEMSESFLLKGRDYMQNTYHQDNVNRSLHKLGQIGQIGQEYPTSSMGNNYETSSLLFPNISNPPPSSNINLQNLTNILNNAAANARTSIPKGVLKPPQTSSFGNNFTFPNLTEQYQVVNQPFQSTSSFPQSGFGSNENSRGFGDNEYGNRGINETFNKVQRSLARIGNQQQSDKSNDFSSIVKDLNPADLMKAQSELKLKVPQNSFALAPEILTFGQQQQQEDENTQGIQGTEEHQGMIEEEAVEGEHEHEHLGGGQEGGDRPYEPDAVNYGEQVEEGSQMQEEMEQPQESMQLEQDTERPSASPFKKHSHFNILEIFQKVQEEEKSSIGDNGRKQLNQTQANIQQKRPLFQQGNPNNNQGRSVTPPRTEDTRQGQGQGQGQRGGGGAGGLEFISHFYTQHRKISAGAMILIGVKNHLVTGGQEGKIQVWNLETKRNLFSFDAHHGEIFRLYYIEEKDMVASCGADGAVCVWDCRNDYKNAKVYKKHEGPVYAMEYISHMNMMASGGEDGYLRMWSVEGPKEEYPTKIASANIGSMCYLKMSKKLAVGCNRGSLRIFNLNTSLKKQFVSVDAHETTGFVSDIASVEEKGILLTAGEDGFVKMWKLTTEEVKFMSQMGVKGQAIKCFAMNYRLNLIITNHADAKVRVWKGSTGQKVIEKYDKSFGESIVLYKEVTRMVSANEGEVKLWQISSSN